MRQFFRGQELPVAGCSDVKVYDDPEEYLNLSDEEKYAIDKIVVLEDDEALPLTADNIPYDLENGESVKDVIEKSIKWKKIGTINNVYESGMHYLNFDTTKYSKIIIKICAVNNVAYIESEYLLCDDLYDVDYDYNATASYIANSSGWLMATIYDIRRDKVGVQIGENRWGSTVNHADIWVM